jgi:hypothetical protein
MPKSIEINLDRQVLFAFNGTAKAYEFDCVSGDEDHPTPLGHFKVNRKAHPYTSKKYHVAMNYAMFFTHTGEAIHQGFFGWTPVVLKILGNWRYRIARLRTTGGR